MINTENSGISSYWAIMAVSSDGFFVTLANKWNLLCLSHVKKCCCISNEGHNLLDKTQGLITHHMNAYTCVHFVFCLLWCRSTLNKTAEKASIEVFTQNLHRLLLTPPVKGRVILGVDPGFKNGCKLAMISATGEVKSLIDYLKLCMEYVKCMFVVYN